MVRHNPCLHEYTVTPTNILSGKGCPKCNKKSKNKLNYEKWLRENTHGEYINLERYIDCDTPIKMKHITCGYEWYTKPTHIVHSNSRCPMCANKFHLSEKRLFDYINEQLEDTNYSAVSQYWFKDCRGSISNAVYFFDYAILNRDNELLVLIERHGKQHYEYVKFVHKTTDEFKKQVNRDIEKENYCKKNMIPLEVIDGRKRNFNKEKVEILNILSKYIDT